MSALELRGVVAGYPGRRVFDTLDLEFAEDRITAILGPNGAGKTTLVRLASGALRAAAGRITLFGRDLDALPARERAKLVAVVPQQSTPAFDFTVGEMVALGRAPHLGLLGIERPEDREIVRDAMDQADVDSLRDRPFRAVSAGERQRTLIARALAQRARLLLLDEPTAFLDLKHRLATYATIHRLHRERGLAVIVVSHDLNLAARQCDRLVLLRDGRVVADGAPAEVLSLEPLRAAYDVEVDVHRDPRSGSPYVIPRS